MSDPIDDEVPREQIVSQVRSFFGVNDLRVVRISDSKGVSKRVLYAETSLVDQGMRLISRIMNDQYNVRFHPANSVGLDVAPKPLVGLKITFKPTGKINFVKELLEDFELQACEVNIVSMRQDKTTGCLSLTVSP